MKDARNILDSLIQNFGQGGSQGGPGGALGGGGLGGMAEQAKGAWNRQSGMTKGAIAGGGLLALLLGGKNSVKMAGGAMKMGGLAVVGSLAYKAFQDWQAGQKAQVGAEPAAATLPAPEGTPFNPTDPEAADDLAARLVQAMVAAAKADGHVTPDELQRIESQLGELGLGADAERMIQAELNAPLDVGRIAGLARTPEEAAEIYTMSLLVADEENPAEKGYLAMLAARLNLDPGLVEHLHAKVASLA